jgi:integrase
MAYLDAFGKRVHSIEDPLAGCIKNGYQVLDIGLINELTGQAGFVGNFTNHSGKRTRATQLYQDGVDEQDILSRTGHRSKAALRK